MTRLEWWRTPPAFFRRVARASAVVILLIVLVSAAIQHMKEREMRLALRSGDTARIEKVLPKLRQLTRAQRTELFLDNPARTGFIAHFERRLNAVADGGHGLVNYRRAEKILAELRSFLPDSQVVQGLTDELRARRNAASALDRPTSTLLDLRARELLLTQSIRRGAVARGANVDRAAPLRAQGRQNSPNTLVHSSATPLPRGSAAQAAIQSPQGVARNDVSPVLAAPVGQETQTISVLASRVQDEDPVARVEALKGKLLSQAQANKVEEALETLRDLRIRLPAKDTFVVRTGPQAIADGYLRLAAMAVKGGSLTEAVTLAERGSEIAPSERDAEIGLKRYRRYVDIDDQLKEQDRLSVHHIRWKISRVAKQSPDEMPAVTQRWVRDLAERIDSTPDPKLASRLSQAGKAIFPEETRFQLQSGTVNGSATALVAPVAPQ